MRRPVVAALLLGALTAEAQVSEEAVLHAVPLETTVRGEVDWKARQLEGVLDEPKAALPAFLSRRGVRVDATGRWKLDNLVAPPPKDKPVARHRNASWVIDFDQASFAPAWKTAVDELGPKPTAAALTAFAGRYLSRKSYDRGLDLASQVATRREGDCTEHAVFLTALLRKAGIPARAMIGLVLVAFPDRVRSYGHMWVEAFVEGRWQVFDAALGTAPAAWLPAGELSDEGPGYALGLAGLLNTLAVRSLELR